LPAAGLPDSCCKYNSKNGILQQYYAAVLAALLYIEEQYAVKFNSTTANRL